MANPLTLVGETDRRAGEEEDRACDSREQEQVDFENKTRAVGSRGLSGAADAVLWAAAVMLAETARTAEAKTARSGIGQKGGGGSSVATSAMRK